MILDRIAADTKLRVNKEKRKVLFSQMRAMAYKKEKNTGFPFEKMLKEPGMHYICEDCKRIRGGRSRSNLVPDGAEVLPGKE